MGCVRVPKYTFYNVFQYYCSLDSSESSLHFFVLNEIEFERNVIDRNALNEMADLSATVEAQLAQLNKESLEAAAKKLAEELQRPDQLAKVNLNFRRV